MRRIVSGLKFILFLVVTLLVTTSAYAALDLEGLPVVKISFEGNEDIKAEVLCRELMIEEGDLFEKANLDLSIEGLEQTGKFESVRAETRSDGNGVAITFIVEEKWYVMSMPDFRKEKDEKQVECRGIFAEQISRELDGQPIEKIQFAGNRVTKEIVLRQELLFQEGEVFTADLMDRSRQSIQNLGLYKTVEARAEPGVQGVIVTFTVSEKWYILPIPRLGINSDTDVSYGGELRWDNAFGYNQRFKLVAEQTDKSTDDTEQELSLNYSIPKIPTQPNYGISAGIEQKRTLTSSVDENGQFLGEYYDYSESVGFSVSHWFKRTAPSQGWRTNVGVRWLHTYDELASGSPELADDNVELNFAVRAGFTAVNDLKYYRNGEEYFASFSFGREALGSDQNFYNLGLEWRRYNTFRSPFLNNLNFQMRTGYNQGKEDVFSLGSSSTLRGIERASIDGDVYALLNVNWLVPIPKYPSFRGVLFTDIGNAWDRSDVDLTDWEYTVGVGARWRIQSLVNVALRVDFGYDPASGEYKAYGGTNYMF